MKSFIWNKKQKKILENIIIRRKTYKNLISFVNKTNRLFRRENRKQKIRN